jgi:dTDP-4-amino-4,6-dideoxygalactose transaminase
MFEIVREFENAVAQFFNAPYAVAVDSCTHAIELSLRHANIRKTSCPSRTYLSVPFTLEKLNLDWQFIDTDWVDYYYLGDTNIIDAAVYWKQGGYIPDTYMCLSFQFQKHLNLVRGGAILVDNFETYQTLKKMSFDGRDQYTLWKQQNIDTIGYHYYMPIDTAQLGLERLPDAMNKPARQWTSAEYPYLPNMTVFKNLALLQSTR